MAKKSRASSRVSRRDRLLQALWPFGQSARLSDHHYHQQHAALDDLARWLIKHPVDRTCIIGPSGAGKSTLLHAIEAHLGDDAVRVDRIALPAAPVGSLGTQAIDTWLATLSSVGLAEAAVLAAQACRLSLGQQKRLQLALAIDSAMDRTITTSPEQPITLIIDELTSGLDHLTSKGLLRTLIRLTTKHQDLQVRLIVAGCDERVPANLRCDRSISIDPSKREVTVITHQGDDRKEPA